MANDTTKRSLLDKLFAQRHLKEEIAARRERLYRLAWSWSHDRALAEDLAQETLGKALASLESLRDPERLDVWLTRILVNTYRDHHRRPAPETGWEDDRECPDCERPERVVERLGVVERTREAIAALGEEQRQVVTLVDLEGFSYAETAGVLDVPVGTVMSRLARARRALRERLSDTPARESARVIPLRKQ